ncbi:MAG: hypothetical protein RBR15_05475 [Sphaerochaeta sp.]|nr:hypothetical protein [Sphaerochaeta sp.]
MGVPEHIRSVKRPKNTIVDDSGRDGVNRYSVRARTGVKYVRDGNPQPANGRVIGHITDGRFVPLTERVSDEPASLSYGAAALAKSISDDLFDDLFAVYPPNEAATIMVIAMLKVLMPGITAGRYSTHYKRTFISKYYPNVALDKRSVGLLFKRLGMDGKKRKAFYASRIHRVAPDHHIAIDGIMRQDTSTINDLSAYSHKAQVDEGRDFPLLYAYEMESGEPLCSEVFVGASIDADAFSTFITDNNIPEGMLVPSNEMIGEKLSLHMSKEGGDGCLLKLIFKQYTEREPLDPTTMQDEYSLIGVALVNFVAALMTYRMVRKAGDADLLDGLTYGDLMEDLSSAWRKAGSTGFPRSGDKQWVHTLPAVLVLLERLGLSEPLIQESKPVGRPKKEEAEPDKPKRPRGRSRKNPAINNEAEKP